MKKASTFVLLFTALSLLLSLQAVAQTSVTKTVGNFTGLKVMSGINVYLSQANAPAVRIEAESEEDLEGLLVEVDASNTLVIRLKNNNSWSLWKLFSSMNDPIKAYVNFQELNSIQLSGGSDLLGQGTLKFNRLDMSASGGSDIKMSLQADELAMKCSGGSDAQLQGYAKFLRAEASGGSDIKARELEAERARVSVSGGSDAEIRVRQELDASASGGSDIAYWGNPTKVNSNASGGSDVTKK